MQSPEQSKSFSDISLGAVYTPPEIAEFLSDWAIKQSKDCVLDLGVGEGSIAFASYKRLLSLGATKYQASSQIFGSEIDGKAFQRFKHKCDALGVNFPKVFVGDFFSNEFPIVDSVIGNPPFVRRSKIHDYESISASVQNEVGNKIELSALTDLCVYFIIKACRYLRRGGRLSIITSDSWLSTRYGRVLRSYLLNNFKIHQLISFDRNVFTADVRAVVLLATKISSEKTNSLSPTFVRVHNGLPPNKILTKKGKVREQKDVFIRNVKNLNEADIWSIHFRKTDIFSQLQHNSNFQPLSEFGTLRIGVQTLAKEFYALTPQMVEEIGIEKEYLTPMVASVRTQTTPIVEIGRQPDYYLVNCDKEKKELAETKLLGYIEEAEEREVGIRGKTSTVIGYQNKSRIQRSKRSPWYNLKFEIDKRRNASILIPRIVSGSYFVVWNKARFIPGEYFLEFSPAKSIPIKAILGALSSSVFEMALRSCSQLYGGGAYTVFPGKLKDAPFPNLAHLTPKQLEKLSQAYDYYVANSLDTSVIDNHISKFFKLSKTESALIQEELSDLRNAVYTSPHVKDSKSK